VWPTQPYPTFDPSRVALWRVFANCILLPRDSIPRDSQSRGSLLATKERNENQAQETQTQRPRWNLHLERRQHPRLLPRPGYTRKLSYDEEGRLTKIDRDNGTTITPVFEYGYGFDGNRRWRKDLAGNTWDWYPCGVACCAGELVAMRSTNGGTSWVSQSSKLSAAGVTMNVGGEWILPSISSTVATVSSSTGANINRVIDAEGVRRSAYSPSASVARVEFGTDDDESTSYLSFQLQGKGKLQKQNAPLYSRDECFKLYDKWLEGCNNKLTACGAAIGIGVTVLLACAAACGMPEPFVSKAVCLACLIAAGVGGIGGAIGCLSAYNGCRNDAGGWLNRCLKKAGPPVLADKLIKEVAR
jgi:hypothetical protein